MRDYTASEVRKLANERYVLIIVDGMVYDVTSFIDDHPGGREVLVGMAGRDATEEFKKIGHSIYAHQKMKLYLVGRVVQSKSILCNKWFYVAVGVAAAALWIKYKDRISASNSTN